MAADMLQVSVDATIAIAFGLAATIISLIAIYIMWNGKIGGRERATPEERLAGRSGAYDTTGTPRPPSCGKIARNRSSRVPSSRWRFLSCGIEDEDESADALRLKGASFNQSSFDRYGAYTAPIEGSFASNLVCENMQKRSMASNSRQET
ncbi:hypothetical protein V8E51_000050 [Hyaloscypha variabilis]